MKEFKHPTITQILIIHRRVLQNHGGSEGICSEELLESAIAAPQASFGGKAIMTDGIQVAAAYLYYLCRNHPFIDGNKRVALTTCLIFLRLNGYQPQPDSDDWESLTLDVAASRLDRAQTTARLYLLIHPPSENASS